MVRAIAFFLPRSRPMILSFQRAIAAKPFSPFDNRALRQQKRLTFQPDVALKLTPNFGIEAREGYMLQKSPGSRLRTGSTTLK